MKIVWIKWIRGLEAGKRTPVSESQARKLVEEGLAVIEPTYKRTATKPRGQTATINRVLPK